MNTHLDIILHNMQVHELNQSSVVECKLFLGSLICMIMHTISPLWYNIETVKVLDINLRSCSPPAFRVLHLWGVREFINWSQDCTPIDLWAARWRQILKLVLWATRWREILNLDLRATRWWEILKLDISATRRWQILNWAQQCKFLSSNKSVNRRVTKDLIKM